MHTLNRNIFTLAICLSMLAGCVDAIGFLYLGGYFISFMSGNSTRLAVHLMDGDSGGVALLASVIVLFVLGAMLGVLARHRIGYDRATVGLLVFLVLLLTLAALSFEFGWGMAAIAFMTLAMGAENAILQRGGEVVGLTYMTGALVKIGQRLAHVVLGQEKWAWVPYLLLWLGLISGGVIGTVLYMAFGLHSIWAAVAWAAMLAAGLHGFRHRLEM